MQLFSKIRFVFCSVLLLVVSQLGAIDYLYVTNYGNGTVSIYDLSDPSNPAPVMNMISGLDGPNGAAITSAHLYLYVANFNDSTISIYDLSDPVNPAPVGMPLSFSLSNPAGIAITSDNQYLYVTNYGDGTVSIFSLSDPVRGCLQSGCIVSHSP